MFDSETVHFLPSGGGWWDLVCVCVCVCGGGGGGGGFQKKGVKRGKKGKKGGVTK